MKNTILFISLFCLPLLLISQTISGIITDAETQKPLAYASVEAEGLLLGTFTNENGYFELEAGQEKVERLQVQHLGFEPQIVPLGDAKRQLSIQLKAAPIVVEGILVSETAAVDPAQSELAMDFTQRNTPPRDLAGLFRDIPGFGLIRRGGYAMDPVFRSFRNEQLNIQYDGGIQAMHACPNRMDPITTHVTPDEVERIELIKGPFSVRYGQTMGGVVNIITETPDPAKEFTIGGTVESGYQFNGAGKTARMGLNGAGKGYDFMLNAGLRDFGNYKNGAGLEIPTSFKSYDYATKAGISPKAGHRIQIGWRQSFGRDILHVGLPMDTREDNSSIVSLDYVAKNLSPKLYGITFKSFYSNVDHIMDNHNRPNFMMVDAVASVDAQTYGGKLELTWQPSGDILLYTGIDYRGLARDGSRIRLVKHNMMTGEMLDTPLEFEDLIWQKATLSDIGLFAESRFFYSDKWSFTAGARLDRVNASLSNPTVDFATLYPDLDTKEEYNISGNLSASYELTQGWSTQLALGRGTRTASMEERFINHFSLGVDAYEYVGNPNLNPEANHQAEWSISRHGQRLNWKVSAFYSYITDYITAAVDSTLSRKYMPQSEPRFAKRFQNIDGAVQKGFEAEAEWKVWEHLQAYGNVSYTWAENLDWDEPLPEIPPFQAIAGLKYERGRYAVDIRSRMVSEQNRIADSFDESTTPGFTTLDLRTQFMPLEGLTAGFAVLNILNTNYYEHLSRGYRNMPENGVIYEVGRQVSVYLKYKF
jgi:iron complex outermembrane receptor protein